MVGSRRRAPQPDHSDGQIVLACGTLASIMNAHVLWLGLAMTACGVSPSDHEAATDRIERLEQQLTNARNTVAELGDRVTELEAKLAQASTKPAGDGLAVDPPRLAIPATKEPATKSTKIALSKTGIFLNGKVIADADLDAALDAIADEDPDASAIVSADEDVDYRDVVAMLDRLQSRGIHKFALAVADNAAASSVARTPRPASPSGSGSASTDLKNPFDHR